MKLWGPVFLALKIRLFLAKSDKKSPKGGGGVVIGEGVIPKFDQFFLVAFLRNIMMHDHLNLSDLSEIGDL